MMLCNLQMVLSREVIVVVMVLLPCTSDGGPGGTVGSWNHLSGGLE